MDIEFGLRCQSEDDIGLPLSAFESLVTSTTLSAFSAVVDSDELSAFGERLQKIEAQLQWLPDILMGEGGDLSTQNELSTAVLISLMTDRRARDDDAIPDGSDPRGWWADAMDGDQIGSRLWLLDRARTTDEAVLMAEKYIKEALQWLVDDGVAKSVSANCSATRGCQNTLDMQIRIEQPSAGDMQFKWRYAWDMRSLRAC